MPNLTPEQISRVYSGPDGKCCCGCSRTYWCNDGSKKSNAAIKRVIAKLSISPELVDIDPTYHAVVIDGRLYIAYLN